VEKDLHEALTLVDGSNFCAHAETHAFLSEAYLGQGKLREALDAARHALDLARESENDLDLGIAWRILGQVLAGRQNGQSGITLGGDSLDQTPSEPQACFLESHQIFKKINAESEAARTLRAWAEFDLQNGRAQEGNKKLDEAKTIFRRLGAVIADGSGRK
jgi:tetratricopeptide (TPR) repeat protein